MELNVFGRKTRENKKGFIQRGAVTGRVSHFGVFSIFSKVGQTVCGRYSSVFVTNSVSSTSTKDRKDNFDWEWAKESRDNRIFEFWNFSATFSRSA